MNSIIEQFGKKRATGKDPALAMPYAAMAAHVVKPDPKHAEAISFVSNLAEQVQRLQADNATLSQQLAVALELGNEFKRLHDIADANARHWEAYAVESRTIFQMFNDLARRGHEHGKAAQARPAGIKEAALRQALNYIGTPATDDSPEANDTRRIIQKALGLVDVAAIERELHPIQTTEELFEKGKTFASELVMNLWIEENHLSTDQAAEVRAGYLSKPKT